MTIRDFAVEAQCYLDDASAPIVYVHPEESAPATLALVDVQYLDRLIEIAVEHGQVDHVEGLVNHSHIEGQSS